jgi:hypothetical protein
MSCKEPLGIFSQASFEVPPNLPYFWKWSILHWSSVVWLWEAL